MTQLSLLVKSCQGHRYNQTDPPPPPALLRDGEKLLNSTLNHPAAEERVFAGLCLSCGGSRAIWWLWGSLPSFQWARQGDGSSCGGHCPQAVRNPLRWGVQQRSVLSNTHCPESSSSEVCRCPHSPSPLPPLLCPHTELQVF